MCLSAYGCGNVCLSVRVYLCLCIRSCSFFLTHVFSMRTKSFSSLTQRYLHILSYPIPSYSIPQPLRTAPSLISSSVASENDIKSALKSFRSSLQVSRTGEVPSLSMRQVSFIPCLTFYVRVLLITLIDPCLFESNTL